MKTIIMPKPQKQISKCKIDTVGAYSISGVGVKGGYIKPKKGASF